jgi:NEDD8-activating enzyme E1 regulatory subunit
VATSKAKCSTQLLRELNPDVNGDYVDENIDEIILNNPQFFKNFDIVVATSLSEKTTISLSNLLWDFNIPLFVCRSIGFIGTARLQVKEHCIMETHPDSRQSDLRLEKPFENLKKHLSEAPLTSKIPWLIVLYKFLQKWSDLNEQRMPKSYKEKTELRETIRLAMTADEENYEEAIRAVNSSFGGGVPNATVSEIFNDDCSKNLNKECKPFWILARAVKEFVEDEGKGLLPLPGLIPDMTADTSSFINLQNVYRAKSLDDVEIVYRRAQQLLQELGKSSDLITEKDVKLFCREAANISIIRGTKISDEYDKSYKAATIATGLETPDSLMGHYIALRAMEKFQTEHGYIPGECHVETDTSRIKSQAGKLLSEWGISLQVTDDLAHELCRYGGAEIHTVSAFLGGCVAQEIIKMITKQYKPINNTLIYDAITSQTATYFI